MPEALNIFTFYFLLIYWLVTKRKIYEFMLRNVKKEGSIQKCAVTKMCSVTVIINLEEGKVFRFFLLLRLNIEVFLREH